MSRLIEFRAWHNEANEYCDGTTSNMFKWIEDGQPVTLEQFTGLLDCNGVKIFEGDIVKPLCGGSCGAFNCAAIVWDSASFSAFANEKHFVFHGINCVKHQIIGNIHQNSELLK